MHPKLEGGRAWKGIDRRLDLFHSRKSLGGHLLVGGDRGWILLCRGRLERIPYSYIHTQSNFLFTYSPHTEIQPSNPNHTPS